MKRPKKKRYWKKIFSNLLLFTLILSIIFVITRIISAPIETNDPSTKVKSDYMLMLIQCALGIVVMKIPTFIEKRKSIDIPDSMEIIFFVFLFCATYLGEVQDFYYVIPFWDTLLHAFSGAMLGAVGIIVVRFLSNKESLNLKLSPFFISFFAFCFAVTAGLMWEIYEFIADGLLDTAS